MAASKDFAGDGGLGTPRKAGGSFVPANRDSSGEEARSELRVTGGAEAGERTVAATGLSAAEAVFGRSSWTIDCLLLALCSSSSSSAISIKRLRRKELVDDEVEPDAACSEQAAESLVSLSSLELAMENMVSYGANFSLTELK